MAAQDILRIPGRHVVRLTYVGKITSEPQLDSEEHSEFQWLTEEEIKNVEGLDIYVRKVLESGLLRET